MEKVIYIFAHSNIILCKPDGRPLYGKIIKKTDTMIGFSRATGTCAFGMNIHEINNKSIFTFNSGEIANQLLIFSNNPGETFGLGVVKHTDTRNIEKMKRRMLEYKYENVTNRLPKNLHDNILNLGNGKKGMFLQDIVSTYERKYPERQLQFRIIACRRIYMKDCPPPPPPLKKGGKIPKSGLYKLHKGEVVVPAHRVKTVDKALKKSGRKPLKKVCKDCLMTKNQLKTRKVH